MLLIVRSRLHDHGWLDKLLIVLLGSATVLFSSAASAQITPDGTLGRERSRVTRQVILGIPIDRIQGGAVRGRNLFHSFRSFNVRQGQGAYFIPPTSIEHIFSRVTGNDPSRIRGRLGVLGDASLYLINPNGILFGENAILDIPGSFTATTANRLQFGDRGSFSATRPAPASSLLTINPSAFLFTDNQIGAIENRSNTPVTTSSMFATKGLGVGDGQQLTFLGGNIRIDGGQLEARGGRVELGAVASPGTIRLLPNGALGFPTEVARANVSLTNGSAVVVSAPNRGNLSIHARNIDLSEGSGLFAGIAPNMGAEDAKSGDIRLDATNAVRLRQASNIYTSTFFNANGDSGDIFIRAGSVTLEEGSALFSSTVGNGNAGNIIIEADDRVTLDASFATASVGVLGDTANIKEGNYTSGDIRIRAGSLSLLNNAAVTTGVFEPSNSQNTIIGIGGDVRIRVQEDVTLNEGVIATGLFRERQPNPATGNFVLGTSGSISIRAGSLSASANSVISSETTEFELPFPTNNEEDEITIAIDDELNLTDSDILTLSVTSEGGGIRIDAGDMRLQGNSNIAAVSNQDGGDIRLAADSIVLFDDSNILAFSVQNAGGNITLNTPAFFADKNQIQPDPLASVDPDNAELFRASLRALDSNGQVDLNASGRVSSGNITAPDTSFIQNNLAELSDSAIDPDELLANSCIARTEQGSSFLITGSGGLPERPGDSPASSYATGEIRSIPEVDSEIDSRHDSNSGSSGQRGGAIEEPQGIYRLPDGRLVMSRTCRIGQTR